ncbi:response regulator transcription factor [Pseudoalteromonas sp. JBTF-M23]|uniref:Response regulator transcription factor n=1 Tax=Pseudoalteromonas caenipelagi TaxID=2726988 RepID=A0A849VFS8_9GAMM|nr:LytTR family DNA-binding domain-containing protein [Pseudoalteromonas caenipelagi]NOU50577.1 response regulator transcription factor [Pseudoalteromonas caenipelagi]
MKRLKTLLVDDETSALEGLNIRLRNVGDIEIIGEATSVDGALKILEEKTPDLIFLDIEMPEKSGFELLKHFQPDNYPAIIFVTAYHQYAIKAFEVRALDYLLKPIRQERLEEAIQRVREHSAPTSPKNSVLAVAGDLKSLDDLESKDNSSYYVEDEKLVIVDGRSSRQLVAFDEIYWIDAAGDYMCIHTQVETFVMRARMKNLINHILPPEFIRIHKSSIVNLKHIRSLEALRNAEFNAYLTNNNVLKVSRTYSANLKAKLPTRYY